MQPLLRSYDGAPILMGIRAENMETLSKPAKDALQVEVLVVEPLGSQNLLTVKIGDDLVKVCHPSYLPRRRLEWMSGCASRRKKSAGWIATTARYCILRRRSR